MTAPAYAPMLARLIADDHLVRTKVGDATTRDLALAVVEHALRATPGGEAAADQWAGGVSEDTLSVRTSEGMAVWAVIPVDADQSPVQAAHAWCADWATMIAAHGVDVQVARATW